MTPKEKAEELFDAMSTNYGDKHHHCTFYVSKNCALIAVNEIIKELYEWGEVWMKERRIYWDEVKQEIENL
jgi:hypothetical protein